MFVSKDFIMALDSYYGLLLARSSLESLFVL